MIQHFIDLLCELNGVYCVVILARECMELDEVPSAAEFLEYVEASQPFVVRQYKPLQPLVKQWNLKNLLRHLGHKKVRISAIICSAYANMRNAIHMFVFVSLLVPAQLRHFCCLMDRLWSV